MIHRRHSAFNMLVLTSGHSSFATMMTVPVESRPRRPARPAICVYSPGLRSLKLRPSCFLMCEKTTHLAGMFTPLHVCQSATAQAISTTLPRTMANVSVANKTLTNPRANNISTTCVRRLSTQRVFYRMKHLPTSLTMGSKPP